MSSVATELEKHFGVLINSKPPGSQRGQVEAITTLSENNIESESVVVSALVRYLKRAPITHKLGAVYIFDSVLRKWIEKAKAQGQPDVSSADEHGTFAAGVARIRDVIEPLVLDVVRVCPPDQREKIKRLVTIWDRSGALPSHMISTFLTTLQQPSEPGSPPPGIVNGIPSRSTSRAPSALGTPPVSAPAVTQVPSPAPAAEPAFDSASSILSRLAAIAHSSNKSTPTPSNNSTAPPPAQPAVPAPAQTHVPVAAPVQPQAQVQTPAYNDYYAGSYSAVNPMQNPITASPASAPAAPPATAAALPPAQAAALATLMSSIPALQGGFPNAAAGGALNPAIAAILQTLALGNAQPTAQPQQNNNKFGFGAYGAAKPGIQPPTGPQADREYGRSPPGQRGRSRSPSGGSGWQRNGGAGNGYDDHKSGRSEYRERSPAGNRASEPIRPRWIEYDKTLPENHIRVLSRTLFIGGVNYSDSELHNIFAAFGEVQSCIVNKDKRHAFVKMLYRDMAARAMEKMKSPEYQHYGLRTRWGVGFGPRDCSDYNTGISVIPINALTEADVKWMHTAKFGGCGDIEITSGMCVEEPDIEIGAGVSSKAISRRIQTDRGGSYGPRSTRGDAAPQQVTPAASQLQAPTQPQSHNHHGPSNSFRGGHGGHEGTGHHGPPARGGRGRGGFRDRGRPRRDFDTPQQFGQGFDYGANY
ncbi:Rpb7-binding protein seb1 [Ceratocystis lukuohia]|uniref:Rpb7-binding protein seb1 n=1 Tax=Ceratocystis lukuohia TaxID=2019550 RepID=A0ABR4MRM7_9PEZI